MATSGVPDYYAVLGIDAHASAKEIKQAYQRESLRTHPDRFPNASADEKRAYTQKFQTIADAYYILSDPQRRAEYDAVRSQSEHSSFSQDESARFFHTSGQGQPEAQSQFANVWADLLRPEMERQTPIWRTSGTVSGAVLGYIVANIPGLIGGAILGHGLGAVRDAKGKSVSEVFLALPLAARASILRTLASKVLESM